MSRNYQGAILYMPEYSYFGYTTPFNRLLMRADLHHAPANSILEHFRKLP